MTPRHTVRILLTTWLLAAVGCSWLPHGDHDTTMPVRPEPFELSQASSPVALQPTASQETIGSPQFRNPIVQRPSQQLGRSGSTSVALGPPAAGNGALLVPIADLSAFVQELEAAPHVDAATRNQILTTALQTPPDLQPQLIRQYRTLLALGQASPPRLAPPTVVQEQSSLPVAAPLPAKSAIAVKKASVVAASHNEPIKTDTDNSQTGRESTSDVQRQLEALLVAMKGTKIDPAEHFTAGDEPNSSPRRPLEKSAVDMDDASWEQLVESAIKKLEERKERQLDSDIREEDEARLRMLYLIADRRDDAVRAIATLEPEMQEYWSKQFFALATLLDSDLIADRSNRLIESKRNLDEALRRLGESAPLFVRNLAFVTAVQSYGAYTPFDDYEFRPGEPVLLYAEVENFRCKETARGHHTALRSSYEIFDSARQKVDDHEFSTNEEYCKNARRDFFTVCEFSIPEKLNPGKYVLRLTVADLNGDKAGESSITFQIRDGS